MLSGTNLNSNVRVTSSPDKVYLNQALSSNIGHRITSNTVRQLSPGQRISGDSSDKKPNNRVQVIRAEYPSTKISGYTPLMMQNSLAPQAGSSNNPLGSQHQILHPTQSTFQPKQSQHRQARELLLQPGFEAQAQTQNIKQSQYHKFTDNFKNQGEDVKIGQADLNIQNY